MVLHAMTGAFLYLRKSLKGKVPLADFNSCIDDIDEQFRKGFLDPELEQLLSTSVPPTTLGDVSFLRTLADRAWKLQVVVDFLVISCT